MSKTKKLILGITAALCSSQILTAAAAPTVTEIKDQKEEADQSLKTLLDSIQSLEDQKKQMEEEIGSLDGQLVVTLSAVD